MLGCFGGGDCVSYWVDGVGRGRKNVWRRCCVLWSELVTTSLSENDGKNRTVMSWFVACVGALVQ